MPAATADAIVDENATARLDALRASLSVLAVIALIALFFTRRIPDRTARVDPGTRTCAAGRCVGRRSSRRWSSARPDGASVVRGTCRTSAARTGCRRCSARSRGSRPARTTVIASDSASFVSSTTPPAPERPPRPPRAGPAGGGPARGPASPGSIHIRLISATPSSSRRTPPHPAAARRCAPPGTSREATRIAASPAAPPSAGSKPAGNRSSQLLEVAGDAPNGRRADRGSTTSKRDGRGAQQPLSGGQGGGQLGALAVGQRLHQVACANGSDLRVEPPQLTPTVSRQPDEPLAPVGGIRLGP